jgi:hypothetical protein
MVLHDRKIPIILGINDTPSSSGQEHHPNSALLCKNYNDLIDYELNGLSGSLDLLAQNISNLSANIQSINIEIQNQSVNIGNVETNVTTLQGDLTDLSNSAEEFEEIFTTLNNSISTIQNNINTLSNSIVSPYIQNANQFISNAVAYTLTSTFVYNSTILDNFTIIYPFTFKKRTRLKGFTYSVGVVFPVNNSFELQFYRSDVNGNPSTPIRNITPDFWANLLNAVGTFNVDVPELENIVFEKDEILWTMFRVHKVGTGTLAGNLRGLLVGALPLLPNTVNNGNAVSFTATTAFNMNLPNPLSQASFIASASPYPYFPFRTIAV